MIQKRTFHVKNNVDLRHLSYVTQTYMASFNRVTYEKLSKEKEPKIPSEEKTQSLAI